MSAMLGMTLCYVGYDVCYMLGMTKIKMSSEEAGSLEFVERRRAALERLVFQIFTISVLNILTNEAYIIRE